MDAHRGRINQIRTIKIEPFGFLTCGNDKFVRVWSQWGSKVGEINLIQESTSLSEWKFGYDWERKRKSEYDNAQQLVQDLQLATIKENEDDGDGDGEQSHASQPQQTTQVKATGKNDSKGFSGTTFITAMGGGPALNRLVDGKPPDSEDEQEKALINTLNPFSRSRSRSKRKDKQSRGRSSVKETEKWDVDKMFPIPPKYVPKPGQLKHSEKQSLRKQSSQIDQVFKINLPGVPNPFQKLKRKPQSS